MTERWAPLGADDEFGLAFANLFAPQIEALFELDFDADCEAVDRLVGEIIATPDFAELFREYMRRHAPGWRQMWPGGRQ